MAAEPVETEPPENPFAQFVPKETNPFARFVEPNPFAKFVQKTDTAADSGTALESKSPPAKSEQPIPGDALIPPSTQRESDALTAGPSYADEDAPQLHGQPGLGKFEFDKPGINIPRISTEEAGNFINKMDRLGLPNIVSGGAARNLNTKTGAVAVKAATDVVADTAEFFTSPMGIATLGLGGLPKGIQKLVGLGFAAQAVYHSPETVLNLIHAKTDDERARSLAALVEQLGVGVIGTIHGLPEGAEKPAPVTAEMKLREMQPPFVPSVPKPSGDAPTLDALHHARDAFTRDFNRQRPEIQKTRQDAIDDIDDQLLRFDRNAVNASRDRTTARVPLAPPEAAPAPAAPSPIPVIGGGRSSLFEQAKREAVAAKAVAPLIETADAAKDVPGAEATAAAAKQAASVIADKASSPVAEPPAQTAGAGKAESATGETPSPGQQPEPIATEKGQPIVTAPVAMEAAAVKPAIQTPDGQVFTGDDHVSAYEEAKKTIPDTSGSKEGFVDAQGNFISREEAAAKTGLPTETEPGKLHSSDLPDEKITPQKPPAVEPSVATPPEPVQRVEAETPSAPETGSESSLESNPETVAQPALPDTPKPESTAEDTTSMKRAVVDTQAKAEGRPAVPPETRPRDEAIVQQAKARADADPTLAKKLVSSIVDDGKTGITEQDAATLLVERRRMRNERKQWETVMGDKNASSTQKGQARTELERIENEQFRLDQAGRAAGREWSDVGRMYQREIAADYSLEALTQKARAIKGAPLSEDEISSLKEKADKYDALQEHVTNLEEAALEGSEHEQLADTLKQLLEDVFKEKKGKTPTTRKAPLSQSIIDYAKTQREAALERIRARRAEGRLNALPVNELIDHAIVGASYIMEGVGRGAKWTAKMVETFGEEVKPFLKEIRTAAEEQIENLKKQAPEAKTKTVEQTKARLKVDAEAGDTLDPKSLAENVRAHIREGLHGEDELMAAVHKDVQEFYPDATERDVRRALIKYGSEVKPPTRDAVETRVRQLKSLVKVQEDITSLQKEEPTWKSQIRDKRTQELRDKVKIRDNLLKQLNLPESEETLASRSKARETALENRIEDIKRELETGEKPPANVKQTARTQREESLMMERDALQEKLNEVRSSERPKPTLAEIEADKAQRGVDRAAVALDRWDRIMKGEIEPEKRATLGPRSNLEEELQAQTEALKRARRDMERVSKSPEELAADKAQKAVDAAAAALDRQQRINKGEIKPEPKEKKQPLSALEKELRDRTEELRKAKREAEAKSPTERYNEARKKMLERQIAEAQDRLAHRDYTPKPKPEPKEKTAEVAKGEADLRKLRQDIQQDMGRIANEKRSTASKAMQAVNKLVTGIKVVGHGTVGMVTHAGGLLYRPEFSTQKIWWQNFGRQFKMWKNVEFHEQLIHQLTRDPEFEAWKNAGASIDPETTYTDYGLYADALKHLSEKGGKPGKMLANFLEGGKRGFDAIKLARLELNKAAWEKVPEDIKAHPEMAAEMRRYIAEMNNKATGAIPSKISPVGKTVESGFYNLAKNPVADIALFAPRLYASRWARVVIDPVKTANTFFQMAADKTLPKDSGARVSPVEAQIAITRAKHAASFAAGYVAALVTNQAILSATGSNQKVNMTDPTKPDWLKFKGAGKEVVADGGLLDPVRLIGQIVIGDLIQNKMFRGETGYGKIWGDLGKYYRGKMNPSLGLVTDVATGKDFADRPLPFPSALGFGTQQKATKTKPKYSLGEWLLQQGPIPLSGGARVVYEGLRKEGMSHLDAMKLMKDAAVSLLGLTGAHAGDDYEAENQSRGPRNSNVIGSRIRK